MILSASRRTDIPAFYGQWFMNRFKEGFVLVPNPRNPQRLSRVELSPRLIDCIVFWTKNPAPMLPHFAELTRLGYIFLLHCTLTPYGTETEPGLPSKARIVETLTTLAKRMGPERIVWRYDPVIVDRRYSMSWHKERFAALCRALQGQVQRCVLSFVDPYKHLAGLRAVTQDEMRAVAAAFAPVAAQHGLQLFTCAEAADLEEFGVQHGACVDKQHLERVLGSPLDIKPDSNQRPLCQCVETVDVGAYDTCPHGCSYCYAVSSRARAAKALARHDPTAPMLTGYPQGTEIVTERSRDSHKAGLQDQYKLL